MKHSYLLLTMLTICLILTSSNSTTNNALAQTKKKLKAVNNSTSSTKNITTKVKVPYIIEVDNESAKNGVTITLAVNAVTIIRCPEEPVKFLPGSTVGIDVFQAAEFDKNLGRNEIYVRPRIAGINTNLVIEFASGPTIIYFKIIEVEGGNNAGDFTGEVVIKNSYYTNTLAETKNSLLASNKELDTLKSRIQELEKQLKEKATSSCQEDRLTTLRLIEDSVIFTSKKNTIAEANVSISQIGRVQKVKGGWIINIAIENRSKNFLSLDSVESPSSKVLTTWSLPKKLSPKAETKTSFFLEIQDETFSEMPNELTLLISGTPLKLKTSY